MYGTFTIIYLHLSISLLVVGFNPFEKLLAKMGIISPEIENDN